MKTLFLILMVLFIGISSSADYGPITMRENENITLDGGQIINFQTTGIYNIQTFGADGSDSAGDGQEIQDAINYTSSQNGYLFAPPGTYIIDRRSTTSGDVVNGSLLRLMSNVHLVGVPGKTIFKVADNMRNSTHSNSILYNWTATINVNNWSIYGITFDGNIANNDISGGWTSSYDAVGAFNASNYSISNCVFQNMVGRWAIFCNQGNGTNYVTGNRVIGTWGHPGIVSDWTAIYLCGDYIFASQNIISPDAEPSASSTGVEVHPNVFAMVSENGIYNLVSGIYYSSTQNTGIRGKIANNDMKISAAGIAVWNFYGNVVDQIDISDNTIEYIVGSHSFHHGIDIGYEHAARNGYIRDAFVHGNVIKTGAGEPTWGIRAKDFVNVSIAGNRIIGPNKAGIVAFSNDAFTDTDYIDIGYNELQDCGTVAGGLDASIWATLDDNLSQIRIISNDIQGGGTTAAYVYADYTPTANVTIKGNVASGNIACTAGIVGTKVIQTNGTVF